MRKSILNVSGMIIRIENVSIKHRRRSGPIVFALDDLLMMEMMWLATLCSLLWWNILTFLPFAIRRYFTLSCSIMNRKWLFRLCIALRDWDFAPFKKWRITINLCGPRNICHATPSRHKQLIPDNRKEVIL